MRTVRTAPSSRELTVNDPTAPVSPPRLQREAVAAARRRQRQGQRARASARQPWVSACDARHPGAAARETEMKMTNELASARGLLSSSVPRCGQSRCQCRCTQIRDHPHPHSAVAHCRGPPASTRQRDRRQSLSKREPPARIGLRRCCHETDDQKREGASLYPPRIKGSLMARWPRLEARARPAPPRLPRVLL